VSQLSLAVGIGLLCALLSALGTNLAFLFKHRGALAAPDVDMRRPGARDGPIRAVRIIEPDRAQLAADAGSAGADQPQPAAVAQLDLVCDWARRVRGRADQRADPFVWLRSSPPRRPGRSQGTRINSCSMRATRARIRPGASVRRRPWATSAVRPPRLRTRSRVARQELPQRRATAQAQVDRERRRARPPQSAQSLGGAQRRRRVGRRAGSGGAGAQAGVRREPSVQGAPWCTGPSWSRSRSRRRQVRARRGPDPRRPASRRRAALASRCESAGEAIVAPPPRTRRQRDSSPPVAVRDDSPAQATRPRTRARTPTLHCPLRRSRAPPSARSRRRGRVRRRAGGDATAAGVDGSRPAEDVARRGV
jgi:hypothetical protein